MACKRMENEEGQTYTITWFGEASRFKVGPPPLWHIQVCAKIVVPEPKYILITQMHGIQYYIAKILDQDLGDLPVMAAVWMPLGHSSSSSPTYSTGPRRSRRWNAMDAALSSHKSDRTQIYQRNLSFLSPGHEKAEEPHPLHRTAKYIMVIWFKLYRHSFKQSVWKPRHEWINKLFPIYSAEISTSFGKWGWSRE